MAPIRFSPLLVQATAASGDVSYRTEIHVFDLAGLPEAVQHWQEQLLDCENFNPHTIHLEWEIPQ